MKRVEVPDSLSALEDRLGYRFRNAALLCQALTHPSYASEVGEAGSDNERLEFLGDALVGAVVSAMLFQRFPDLSEGDLTRLRSAVVRKDALAGEARALDLGGWLRLSRGAERVEGLAHADSVLCDTFEALVGAIYLDGGFAAVERFLQERLRARLEDAREVAEHLDPKSSLQVLCLKAAREVPRYEVLDSSGPPHARRFRVRVTLFDGSRFEGEGRSRREAEQAAAARALAACRAGPQEGEDQGHG